MAREELSINVTAKDDASKVLDNVSKKVDKLEGEDVKVKVGADTDDAERDIQGLLEKVDKLGAGQAANLLLSTNAAQITTEIADLVIKLDTLDAEDPTVDVTVANIAQLTGDLDQISAKAKEINDTPIKLDTSGATQGIDAIGKSADSSKSVLANMVGNSVQDLGVLGGVAGSAGVAIGQMGEYMADARASGEGFGSIVSNFGALVGPMAALGVATLAVSQHMEGMKLNKEFNAKQVEDMVTAMKDAQTAASALQTAMEETGKVDFSVAKKGFFGIGQEVRDIIPDLDRFGLTLEQFQELGASGGGMEQLADMIIEVGKATGELSEGEQDAFQRISEGLQEYQANLAAAQATQDAYNRVHTVTKEQVEEAAAAFEKARDPVGQYADEFERIAAAMASGATPAARDLEVVTEGLGITMAEAFGLGQGLIDEHTAAQQALAEAVGATSDMQAEAAQRLREQDGAYRQAAAGMDAAIDAADALAAALDRVNETSELDFSLMALDTVDSFDAMKEAIKGTKDVAVDWATVDLTPDSVEELKGIPDELAAVTEGISGMRDTIQTELNAAFETGGIDAYTEKAEFFRTQVLEQFPGVFQKMGASSEEATAQAQALADELGLMPEDIEIMIQLTREEEARAALEQFSSFIDTYLPPEVAVAIHTAISAGDIEGALTTLNTELINRGYDPIVLPTDADTAGATTAVDEAVAYADGAQGIMGLDADPASAEGTISDVEDGSYHATVDTDADTGEAEGDISKVEKAKYAATIKATADTAEAAGKLIDEESKPRLAVIVAKALTLAAAAELDGVADKSRTADIKADANTGAAESELNNTARNRTAVITADANTSAAESELNRTARNRSTTITAHTVTVGGGTTTLMTSTTRGRGRGAATYAAPAPVTANVTINTSVIGNRYDVMRAVTDATRRSIRLAGSRQVLTPAGSR